MIEIRTDFAALLDRLSARAAALAQVERERRALRPTDPTRWRKARWLWPLFTKGER